MPSFEVKCDVEFEVYCSCGAGICHQSFGANTPGRGEPYVDVSPCDTCLDNARNEANVEAWAEANEIIAKLKQQIEELTNV